MQFLYPALTWGFFLTLVPIAIHLINLVRQRRVDWAAMEFLLRAYRRHRRWIWLKQLILLLLRILLIALLVAIMAHLVTTQQFTQLLGRKTTHHVVLLDDSYSMSDRDTISAFDRAVQSIADLAEQLSQQPTLQRMTLLRFSQAARAVESSPSAVKRAVGSDERDDGVLAAAAASMADIAGRVVDTGFRDLLADLTGRMIVSELASGPEPALQAAEQLAAALEQENVVIYVLSDFRQRDWQGNQEWTARIKRLQQQAMDVRLVRCVADVHPNLAITDCRPMSGTRAAGVPLFCQISVKNQGDRPATNVTVQVWCDSYRDDPSTDRPQRESSSPTAITIPRLAPGESVTERCQVYFPTTGSHVVRAVLPPDAIAADNVRAAVVDLPDGIPVLMIDGDPAQQNARFLATVFQPSERVRTGVRPDLRDLAFLRDANLESLSKYASIFLLDVPRLDERARRLIGEYVKAGGGLAIFLGPETRLDAFNEWHDGDVGAMPLRLERVDELGPSLDQRPDIKVTDHGLLRTLQGDANPLLRSIHVQRYIRISLPESNLDPGSPRVLASLRSGYPFVVEYRLGTGRVVLQTSTLAPTWNNWATQPTYVVFLLELQSYLSSDTVDSSESIVGSKLDVLVSPDEFRSPARVAFLSHRSDSQSSAGRIDAVGSVSSNEDTGVDSPSTTSPSSADQSDRAVDSMYMELELQPVIELGAPMLRADWTHSPATDKLMDRAGVLSLRLDRQNGESVVRRFARNVAADEGDMRLVSNSELSRGLIPDRLRILRDSDLHATQVDESGHSWLESLLAIFVGLLFLEQWLQYRFSYHPPGVRAAV